MHKGRVKRGERKGGGRKKENNEKKEKEIRGRNGEKWMKRGQ